MEKGELTEGEILEALQTDPKAIAFRERISSIYQTLGEEYTHRAEMAYREYVTSDYRR